MKRRPRPPLSVPLGLKGSASSLTSGAVRGATLPGPRAKRRRACKATAAHERAEAPPARATRQGTLRACTPRACHAGCYRQSGGRYRSTSDIGNPEGKGHCESAGNAGHRSTTTGDRPTVEQQGTREGGLGCPRQARRAGKGMQGVRCTSMRLCTRTMEGGEKYAARRAQSGEVEEYVPSHWHLHCGMHE